MAALGKPQQDELDLFSKAMACEREHVEPVEEKVRQEKEAKFKSDISTRTTNNPQRTRSSAISTWAVGMPERDFTSHC